MIGRRGPRAAATALCVLALAAMGASSASAAFDDPLFILDPGKLVEAPPYPIFEDPCGLAVDDAANLYLSDYYHHTVDVFRTPATPSLSYVTRLQKVDPADGPCALALSASGALYLNNYHRNVEKLVPSAFPPIGSTTYTPAGVIDSNHPTGVAVDPATGNVYVDDRDHVAVYGPSGTSLGQVGTASLTDAYGLAISSFPTTAGYLYVPDAGTDTLKVYDPATDTASPAAVIDGEETPSGAFISLRDAAVAVDRVSGEIYLADNLQPEYTEHPETVIYVFDAAGAYEGRLKRSIVNGAPPGLAVDNSATATQGRVYVTSGNSENSILYVYPPGAATTAAAPLASPAPAPSEGAAGSSLAHSLSAPAAKAAPKAAPSTITQKGTLRVTVNGRLAPKRLPRQTLAPISVSIGGEISTTDKSPPPRLQSLRIELNRNGRLDYAGLPTCPYDSIQPASSARALSACRSSLVGEGSFEAEITLSGQEPYPTEGKLLVFNGIEKGKPVLFGQIYAPRPFATSFVIVFSIQKIKRGPYGTALSASLPAALGSWGNLTGIEMTLSRRYSYKGHPHSYISSGCPAPKGFPGAVFSLARTEFGFAGGAKLASVLSGECRVR